MSHDLFEEFAGEQVRKLGVRVSNLSFGAETQPSLSAWSDETDSDEKEPPSSGQQSLTDFEGDS
jgi:DNA polymerase IV (DinB-like DNA polymerase)